MRRILGPVGILAIALPATAFAAPAQDARAISLPSQPLGVSLQAVAQRFGIELLFSQNMVAGRIAPGLSGRLRLEQVLQELLAGSMLTVRKTPDGSYVIAAAPVAASEQPDATPDILVLGRRSQNTDIRRSENDVRPYQVVSREQIATSHVATIEELAGKRLSANAQGASLSQKGAAAEGETASSINLRGLGTDQTLILVDGRRLPQMPGEVGAFLQSDVNALPPEALDRVEAITATAGGIYGPGATAGVINLVLRRDYRGVDLAVTRGLTAREDAPYGRVDLRIGFTPDHGATDVMLDVAQSTFAGLNVGDRNYQYRANVLSFANAPLDTVTLGVPPASKSLTVISYFGDPLVLKPGYGGAALGSSFTYAPPANGRSATALSQVLTANAGKIDLTPPDGGGSTLLSGRRTTSIIASVRHRAGPIELFADYLRLENRGHARAANQSAQALMTAGNPLNPFLQDIVIYAPGPEMDTAYDFRTLVTRVTGGAIIDLPGAWRGEGDYSLGSSSRSLKETGANFTLAGLRTYYGDTAISPLDNYPTYLASFDGLTGTDRSSFQQSNRFADASLRLAGPIVGLGGGNLTATLLAERRSERVSGGTSDSDTALEGPTATVQLGDYAQITRSLYGELRAPLIDAVSGFRLLRGLELQLAVRYDDVNTQAAEDTLSLDGGGTRSVHNAATVYTAGFKTSPLTGVLLRASISTGTQPLTVAELSRRLFKGIGYSLLPDPKRGNLVDLYFFDEVTGGPPDPQPEHARSLSAGVVVQPVAVPGLRVSLDYTHITKSGEDPDTTAADVDYFIANEALYPGRVTRLSLTAADAALGYTGGLISQVDVSSLQTGRTIIDAVDATADYRLPTQRAGTLEVRIAATWQPRFTRVVGLGVPNRDFVGSVDGTLPLRGNADVRWTLGAVSLSASGQFVSRYRITSAIETTQAVDETVLVPLQGSTRIAAAATLDMAIAYRIAVPAGGISGRPRTLDLRFGVQDVLDSLPATVIDAAGNYSGYADPRRRRFDFTVATSF